MEVEMKVTEARTNGVNYQLHIHCSEEGEILSEPKIEKAMEVLGLRGLG